MRAVDPLREALALKPASVDALEQLTAAYLSLNDPLNAANALEKLVAHAERTLAQQSHDSLTLAELLGRQGEHERAATVLEAALDSTPGSVEALQALETVLAKVKAWPRLAKAYARIIEQAGATAGSASARATLWRALGELRLHRLDDRPGALDAFGQSAKLLPHDAPAQNAFADLALTFAHGAPEALASYLRVPPSSVTTAKVCLAARLSTESENDHDTAWLAARAAQLTGSLDAGHRALLSRVGDSVAVPPTMAKAVNGTLWREHLLDPLARAPLGRSWPSSSSRGFSSMLSEHRIFRFTPRSTCLTRARACPSRSMTCYGSRTGSGSQRLWCTRPSWRRRPRGSGSRTLTTRRAYGSCPQRRPAWWWVRRCSMTATARGCRRCTAPSWPACDLSSRWFS